VISNSSNFAAKKYNKKMPTVRVETNLEFGVFPPQFMTLFLYFLADLFGKDRQLMKYVFDTEKKMSMVS
jgi:hypothetical protein